MRTRRSLAVIALGAALLAACGGDDAPEPADTAAPTTSGMPADGGLTVAEALATDAEGPLTVRGFLLDDGTTVRLCDAVLESYPPQCGGDSVEVEGVAVAELEGATTEGEISWVEQASLTGELTDGVLVVSATTAG